MSSGALSRMAAGDMAAVIDSLATARRASRLFHIAQNQVNRTLPHRDCAGRPVDLDHGVRAFRDSQGQGRAHINGWRPAEGYSHASRAFRKPSSGRTESALKRLEAAITEPVSVTGSSAIGREVVTSGVPDSSLRLRSPADGGS